MSEVTERAKALIDGEAETARAKAAVVAELEQSIARCQRGPSGAGRQEDAEAAPTEGGQAG